MSRRGRAGAPTDEQLLAALDRLVEVEGIVKASERLVKLRCQRLRGGCRCRRRRRATTVSLRAPLRLP